MYKYKLSASLQQQFNLFITCLRQMYMPYREVRLSLSTPQSSGRGREEHAAHVSTLGSGRGRCEFERRAFAPLVRASVNEVSSLNSLKNESISEWQLFIISLHKLLLPPWITCLNTFPRVHGTQFGRVLFHSLSTASRFIIIIVLTLYHMSPWNRI